MANIVNATDKTYKAEVQSSTTPVIVDLWAPWCQPCKAINKDLEAISETYKGRVKVVKVNVDENPELVKALEIRSVPTILFYSAKGSSPIAIVGATTAKQMIARFRLEELPSAI
jgi:thioredoxin